MKNLLRMGLALTLALLCLAPAESRESDRFLDAGVGHQADVERFLSTLKATIGSNDRNAVAALINFPVQVGYLGGGGKMIDKSDFSAYYDSIFSTSTEQLLANASVNDLYVSDDGVAIGCGQIWFGVPHDASVLRMIRFDYSKYSAAGVPTVEDACEVDAFFLGFQSAVKRRDHVAVESMVNFPLPVTVGSRRILIRSKDTFEKEFPTLLGSKLSRDIISQQVSSLWCNYSGIMSANGEVWIQVYQIDGKLVPRISSLVNP